MAVNYYIWADGDNANRYTALSSVSGYASGFQPNSLIYSQQVNTALAEATKGVYTVLKWLEKKYSSFSWDLSTTASTLIANYDKAMTSALNSVMALSVSSTANTTSGDTIKITSGTQERSFVLTNAAHAYTADSAGSASNANILTTGRSIGVQIGTTSSSTTFNGSSDVMVNLGPSLAGVSITGNAGSANKINTDAGSTDKPVYFANGIPVACGSSLNVNITGSASSADTASSATTASTADKIANALTINGTPYDGSSPVSITIETGLDSAGSLQLPVWINEDGQPRTITSLSLEEGSVTATSFYATSDERLKKDIEDFEYHSCILDVPVKSFTYESTGERTFGFIAQELQKTYPELVHEGKDGYLSISQDRIVYLLLEEMKKMRKELDELKGGK